MKRLRNWLDDVTSVASARLAANDCWKGQSRKTQEQTKTSLIRPKRSLLPEGLRPWLALFSMRKMTINSSLTYFLSLIPPSCNRQRKSLMLNLHEGPVQGYITEKMEREKCHASNGIGTLNFMSFCLYCCRATTAFWRFVENNQEVSKGT